MKNYFNVAILYQEEPDDNNEAKTMLDDGLDKASVEIDSLIFDVSNININPNIDDEGEWVFNKYIAFEYVLSYNWNWKYTN